MMWKANNSFRVQKTPRLPPPLLGASAVEEEAVADMKINVASVVLSAAP